MEKRKKYTTFEEAQAAVKVLGINGFIEYKNRYREDPGLPSNPKKLLGWTNWYEFFGKGKKPEFYLDYESAKAAARRLGIKNGTDYQKRYREDPRLPPQPNKKYENKGWTSWYDFLGNQSPAAIEAKFPIIMEDAKRWIKASHDPKTKRFAIRGLLSNVYLPQGLPDDPRYLLKRSNAFDVSGYQNFIESQAESARRPYHKAITGFFEWLLSEYCVDIDGEERVILAEYRNPFVTALAGYEDSLNAFRPTQSTKSPLAYEYILRARNYLVPNSEQALHNRPTLKSLHHLHDLFSTRNDWVEVEESVIDKDDPNCVWRIIEIYRNSAKVRVYQIWSPVNFIALYALLRFPLRGQQILWLDSGEADKEIPVIDAGGGIRWEKNSGPLTGKGSKKRREQGAVQRGQNGFPKFYITTNKTGVKDGGYEVDWLPDDLVYWFIVLREWQAKYNPITEPTYWSDIGLEQIYNPGVLRSRGTQCFLFRTYNCGGRPISTKASVIRTLPILLYAIQREGEDLAAEKPGGNSRSRYESVYTPHSLRVSLITAFIADGGALLPVISKLVGHSSLVMTIYYTKLNNHQMRRIMGEAEKRAFEIAKEKDIDTVRTHGLSHLRGNLIATDGNSSLLEMDVPASACIVFDWGICPMSGASCDEGGDLLSESKNSAWGKVYAPVTASYLGKKNCPRCRFFVTGVPFLGGLVALANEISLEIYEESRRYQEFTKEFEELEQQWYDATQNNMPDLNRSKRKAASANQQQSAEKLDTLLGDLVSINNYVQACIKLINEGEPDKDGEPGVRLIVPDFPQVNVTFNESKTSYHLLAEIIQNATIYKSSNPSRALPMIGQIIDRMAENNGLTPAMFRLNDRQKISVANELNKLLLMRLGSWERIDDLMAGSLMLPDIDTYEPELTRISLQIKDLLSNPNRDTYSLTQEG